jgi:hypothetical protein
LSPPPHDVQNIHHFTAKRKQKDEMRRRKIKRNVLKGQGRGILLLTAGPENFNDIT